MKSNRTCATPRRNVYYHTRKPRRRKKKSTWTGRLVLAFLLVLLGVFLFFLADINKLSYPFLYSDDIQESAKVNNLDPLLVAAVIREESRFQANAVSNKGACGLMQLMPATAEEIAEKMGEPYTKSSLMLPATNIRYGTSYLAFLMKRYDGDLVLTLAAYNAGIGRVDGWTAKKDGAFTVSDIPIQETHDYVIKVLRSYESYQRIY